MDIPQAKMLENVCVASDDSTRYHLADYLNKCYIGLNKESGDVEVGNFPDQCTDDDEVGNFPDQCTDDDEEGNSVYVDPKIPSEKMTREVLTEQKPSSYLPANVEKHFDIRQAEPSHTDYVGTRTGELRNDFNTSGAYIKLTHESWTIAVTPIDRSSYLGPVFWGFHYDDKLIAYYIEPDFDGDRFNYNSFGNARLIPTKFGAIVAMPIDDSPGHLFVIKNMVPSVKSADKR